jgi:hypothetical protein
VHITVTRILANLYKTKKRRRRRRRRRRNTVFWDVTLRGSSKNRHFGGT